MQMMLLETAARGGELDKLVKCGMYDRLLSDGTYLIDPGGP